MNKTKNLYKHSIEERRQQLETRSNVYIEATPTIDLIRQKGRGDLSDKRYKLVCNLLSDDWLQALGAVPCFLGTDYEQLVLEASIENAIRGNAPLMVITSLLDMGAGLPASVIKSIAISGNAGLASKLLPYGLDIHFEDSLGMNALSYIIQTGDDEFGLNDVFPLLLDLGVSVQPKNSGCDPLNLALTADKMADVTTMYIRMLLDHGAPVECSHRQQMDRLKHVNRPRYNQIVTVAPELTVKN